jgi:hypothetical protein
VGIWSMTNTNNVAMYIGLRPICGISLIGAQSIGPSPYPATYLPPDQYGDLKCAKET